MGTKPKLAWSAGFADPLAPVDDGEVVGRVRTAGLPVSDRYPNESAAAAILADAVGADSVIVGSDPRAVRLIARNGWDPQQAGVGMSTAVITGTPPDGGDSVDVCTACAGLSAKALAHVIPYIRLQYSLSFACLHFRTGAGRWFKSQKCTGVPVLELTREDMKRPMKLTTPGLFLDRAVRMTSGDRFMVSGCTRPAGRGFEEIIVSDPTGMVGPTVVVIDTTGVPEHWSPDMEDADANKAHTYMALYRGIATAMSGLWGGIDDMIGMAERETRLAMGSRL